MANKRMFSKDITASDAFLDMPASTQALYFHLGMEADDDGFIGNPKKVMRVIGVSEDDIKILLSKRFLLSFPSGIVVVKHHRINNNWDKYNCKRTPYLEEFSQLRIKENKAYTLDNTQGIPLQSENSLKTVFRIEENRIDNKVANANFPIQRKSEREEDFDRPQKEKKPKRNLEALRIQRVCLDLLEKGTGLRPAENNGGYFQVIRALKELKESEIEDLVNDAIDTGRAQKYGNSLTAILSATAIAKYKLAYA